MLDNVNVLFILVKIVGGKRRHLRGTVMLLLLSIIM